MYKRQEELFGRLKAAVAWKGCKQKDFLISIIEKAIEEVEACLLYTSMPPEQSLQFHAIMHGYRDLADKYGLWTAAIFIKEYGCSDDGFMDFRAWLIAQGKDIYMAALENPDSLTPPYRYLSPVRCV